MKITIKDYLEKDRIELSLKLDSEGDPALCAHLPDGNEVLLMSFFSSYVDGKLKCVLIKGAGKFDGYIETLNDRLQII